MVMERGVRVLGCRFIFVFGLFFLVGGYGFLGFNFFSRFFSFSVWLGVFILGFLFI